MMSVIYEDHTLVFGLTITHNKSHEFNLILQIRKRGWGEWSQGRGTQHPTDELDLQTYPLSPETPDFHQNVGNSSLTMGENRSITESTQFKSSSLKRNFWYPGYSRQN